ncbi:MAG: DUF192 domain-containing protein [Rhodospirillales bacterium]
MKVKILALVGVAVALLLGSVAQAQPQPPEPSYPKSEAVIRRANGGDVPFKIELALTPEQQQHGLMFRKEVKPYEGMLFDFGPPRPIAMWMQNTLVPLDMLFIAADGRITRIAANTKPLSTDTIESGGPVKAVLEITGGSALLLGIKPGDHVIHPMFSLKSF